MAESYRICYDRRMIDCIVAKELFNYFASRTLPCFVLDEAGSFRTFDQSRAIRYDRNR